MPTRSCRICRTRGEKANLTRWVSRDGQWVEDATKTMPGRGFYTDKSECAEKLTKGRK